MANPTDKQISLLIPKDLLNAAKSRASQDGKPLTDWILAAIRDQLQTEEELTRLALILGRIDSRIDRRTASLEQRIEGLTHKIESLVLQKSDQLYTEDNALPSPTNIAKDSRAYR